MTRLRTRIGALALALCAFSCAQAQTTVPDRTNSPTFTAALADHNAGRYDQCFAKLDQEPSRFEVHYLRALCLLRAQKYLSARKHIALSGNKARSPVQIRDQQQLEKLYRQAVPLTVQLDFAIRPSDNIDRITDAETVTVNGLTFSVDDAPESGISTVVAPALSLRLLNKPLSKGVATVHADAVFRYETLSDRERTTWDLRLRGTYRTRAGTTSVQAGQLNDAVDEDVFKRLEYIAASRNQNVGPFNINLDGRVEHIDWILLDTTGESGQIGFRALTKGRFRIGPVLRAGVVETDTPLEERDWYSYGVIAETHIGSKFPIVLGLQANRLHAEYREPHPFFGETRQDRDDIIELTALAPRAQWLGFTPKLTLRREERKSTLSFYSYERTEYGLGLARAF